MAMIKCKACGKEISSEAVNCASCGHPTPKQELNSILGKGSNLAIAGMILSIISIIVLPILGIIGVLIGIIVLIMNEGKSCLASKRAVISMLLGIASIIWMVFINMILN